MPMGMFLQTYYACAYCIVTNGYGVSYGLYIYISAWASALLVQTTVGNARASRCETGNGYRLPRFSYPHVTFNKHAESGEFIGDKTYKQL